MPAPSDYLTFLTFCPETKIHIYLWWHAFSLPLSRTSFKKFSTNILYLGSSLYAGRQTRLFYLGGSKKYCGRFSILTLQAFFSMCLECPKSRPRPTTPSSLIKAIISSTHTQPQGEISPFSHRHNNRWKTGIKCTIQDKKSDLVRRKDKAIALKDYFRLRR